VIPEARNGRARRQGQNKELKVTLARWNSTEKSYELETNSVAQSRKTRPKTMSQEVLRRRAKRTRRTKGRNHTSCQSHLVV